MTERKGDWIQCASGRPFWPLDPRADEVCIQDIAHALSMQCRYGGHTSRFYSVAEHSIIVSQLCAPADALWGLLHDAAEAYAVDLPRPIKAAMPVYKAIENGITAVIAEAFGLPPDEPASVKQADHDLIYDERMALMKPKPEALGWKWGGQPRGALIIGHMPSFAEYLFLKRFAELTKARA